MLAFIVLLFSFVGFFAIAVIVSFDVAGLTIAKAGTIRTNSDRRYWAVLNGFWHAGLLGIYALAISGFLDGFSAYFAFLSLLADWASPFLTTFPDSMKAVAGFFSEHTQIIAGVIGIAVIWWTYSVKIVDVPSDANPDDLPLLARTVYKLFMGVARFLSLGRVSEKSLQVFFRRNAEAALVAVDMLALALLAKNLGLMPSLISISVFVLIVFCVVSAICYLVAYIYRVEDIVTDPKMTVLVKDDITWLDSRTISKKWWMISLRLLEPWLIFYFSLELISYLLFGQQVHTIGFLIGASMMLYPLVKKHGLDEIIDATVKTLHSYEIQQTTHSNNVIVNAEMKPGELIELALNLFKIILGFTVFYLFVCILWKFYSESISSPSLDSLVTLLFSIAGLVSLPGIIFSQNWRVFIGKILDWITENRQAFQFTILAVLIAALTPIFHEVTLIVTNNSFESIPLECRYYNLGVQENHAHAAQVVILLIWGLVISSLLNRFEHDEISWEEFAKGPAWLPIARPLIFISISILAVMLINQEILNLFNAYNEFAPKNCS